MYTPNTPVNQLDLRCEFDVPRFADLTATEQPTDDQFAWFQTAHDFAVPSSKQVERDLKLKIL